MAEKKESKSSGLSAQSEEAREAALRRSQTGRATATGQARADHFAEEPRERPEPEKKEIVGDPKPDFAKAERGEPQALQAEEAIYAPNGTVPSGMTSSPSGPVPLSVVARTPEEAAERHNETLQEYEKHLLRQESHKPLDEETINRASAAELRAVAYDRGLDIGQPAGARATRERFRRAQEQNSGAAREGRSASSESSTASGRGKSGGKHEDGASEADLRKASRSQT